MPRTRPSLVSPLLVACLALTAAAPPPDPDGDLAAAMLAAHNVARSEVGVAPMRWNPALAADASRWAEHLATTGRFEHDHGPDTLQQGENLWAGTRNGYRPNQMARGWLEEKRVFRPGIFPDNSTTGSWQDVGHYTQVIWRETREMGCALARGRDEDVLVCRYATAGNVIGESPI